MPCSSGSLVSSVIFSAAFSSTTNSLLNATRETLLQISSEVSTSFALPLPLDFPRIDNFLSGFYFFTYYSPDCFPGDAIGDNDATNNKNSRESEFFQVVTDRIFFPGFFVLFFL